MSKIPVECEVYGLFADLIPAEALAEGEDLHWGRARQGLTPDFRIRVPTSTGPTDSLAELKFISAGVSWYPRGVEGRGTERRASKLPAEYKNKLAILDRKFHGTTNNETGPAIYKNW